MAADSTLAGWARQRGPGRCRLDRQSASAYLTVFLRALPGVKRTTRRFGILIAAPVCGLRAVRAFRCDVLNVPKPTKVIESPFFSALVMPSMNESTAAPAARLGQIDVLRDLRNQILLVHGTSSRWIRMVSRRALRAPAHGCARSKPSRYTRRSDHCQARRRGISGLPRDRACHAAGAAGSSSSALSRIGSVAPAVGAELHVGLRHGGVGREPLLVNRRAVGRRGIARSTATGRCRRAAPPVPVTPRGPPCARRRSSRACCP